MNRLAVEFVMRKRPVVDLAVALASELVATGQETPSTIDVASLYEETPMSEAESIIRSMLTEQGITIPLFGTDDEGYATLRHALAYWDLPLEDFGGPFYSQVPDWDQQSPLDRQIITMLEQRDHESHPDRRREVAEEIWEVIRRADSAQVYSVTTESIALASSRPPTNAPPTGAAKFRRLHW